MEMKHSHCGLLQLWVAITAYVHGPVAHALLSKARGKFCRPWKLLAEYDVCLIVSRRLWNRICLLLTVCFIVWSVVLRVLYNQVYINHEKPGTSEIRWVRSFQLIDKWSDVFVVPRFSLSDYVRVLLALSFVIYIDDIFSIPFEDSFQSRSKGGWSLKYCQNYSDNIDLFTISGNKYIRRQCRYSLGNLNAGNLSMNVHVLLGLEVRHEWPCQNCSLDT